MLGVKIKRFSTQLNLPSSLTFKRIKCKGVRVMVRSLTIEVSYSITRTILTGVKNSRPALERSFAIALRLSEVV